MLPVRPKYRAETTIFYRSPEVALWPKHPKCKNQKRIRFSYFTFENEKRTDFCFSFAYFKTKNKKGIRFSFANFKTKNKKGIRLFVGLYTDPCLYGLHNDTCKFHTRGTWLKWPTCWTWWRSWPTILCCRKILRTRNDLNRWPITTYCTCAIVFVRDLFCQIKVFINTMFCHRKHKS